MDRAKIKWIFFDMGSTLIDESAAIEHRIREVIEGTAGCKPEEAAMVGDRLDNDIIPANDLGMYTIWIKQGNWVYASPGEKLEYPDLTISSLKEMENL